MKQRHGYDDFVLLRVVKALRKKLPVVHYVVVREHHALGQARSEEHTSELQLLRHLVCRLLLEKTMPLMVAGLEAAGSSPGGDSSLGGIGALNRRRDEAALQLIVPGIEAAG